MVPPPLEAPPPPAALPLSDGSSYPTTPLYQGETSLNSCNRNHCPEPVSPTTRATGTLSLSQTKSPQCLDLVAKAPSATCRWPLLSQDTSPAAGGTQSSKCNPRSRFAAKSSSIQPAFEPPRPQPQLATSSSGCIFPSESLMTFLPQTSFVCTWADLASNTHPSMPGGVLRIPQSRKTMTRHCLSGQ